MNPWRRVLIAIGPKSRDKLVVDSGSIGDYTAQRTEGSRKRKKKIYHAVAGELRPDTGGTGGTGGAAQCREFRLPRLLALTVPGAAAAAESLTLGQSRRIPAFVTE